MLCRVISYSYSSLLVVCPPAGHDHTETHSCPGLVKKSVWTTGPSMWSSHVKHFFWIEACKVAFAARLWFTWTILNYSVCTVATVTMFFISELSTACIAERPSRHKQRHTGQGRLLHPKCCVHIPAISECGSMLAGVLQLYIIQMTERIKDSVDCQSETISKENSFSNNPRPPHHTHTQSQDRVRGDGVSRGWSPWVDRVVGEILKCPGSESKMLASGSRGGSVASGDGFGWFWGG